MYHVTNYTQAVIDGKIISCSICINTCTFSICTHKKKFLRRSLSHLKKVSKIIHMISRIISLNKSSSTWSFKRFLLLHNKKNWKKSFNKINGFFCQFTILYHNIQDFTISYFIIHQIFLCIHVFKTSWKSFWKSILIFILSC